MANSNWPAEALQSTAPRVMSTHGVITGVTGRVSRRERIVALELNFSGSPHFDAKSNLCFTGDDSAAFAEIAKGIPSFPLPRVKLTLEILS